MKIELRIIDGVCRVANVDIKGNIINVVKDYRSEESKKIRLETERKFAKQEKEMNELKEKIAEDERMHEIHHGKRHKYQRYNKATKEINSTMKNLLQRKVSLGIIDKKILDIKTSKELLDNWARERDFYNYEEYLDIIALGRGFTCYEEYIKVWSYYPGMPNPIKENRLNNKFIGVYIGENGVTEIYEGSKRVPYHNPGYDIICPKGYKIDVKATVLSRYNTFSFGIQQNKTADYFALVGFDNIIELKPLHIWVIKNDTDIHGRPLKELCVLKIINEPRYIQEYQKYEKFDKLDMLKSVCEEFNAKKKIEIVDYSVTNRSEILETIAQIIYELHGKISPNDILFMLKKKKKETISDRPKITPGHDIIKPCHY